MTIQQDLPHKVSQLRHDLDDLYELMTEVNKSQTRMTGALLRHGNRFEELQQTLDVHSGRLDRLEDGQRRLEDNQRLMADNQRLMADNQRRLEDGQRRLEDNQQRLEDGQRRLEDNQRQQFEHLSVQLAEIFGVLRPEASANPSPASER